MSKGPGTVLDGERCPLCGKQAENVVTFDPSTGSKGVICQKCEDSLNTRRVFGFVPTRIRSKPLPKLPRDAKVPS
ncbi:MAG: hypothetical protein IT477_10740 [Rhodanobacteraceae bacterium]|nr:hypothetical protein [Rhodanobacteraceae bacterium]